MIVQYKARDYMKLTQLMKQDRCIYAAEVDIIGAKFPCEQLFDKLHNYTTLAKEKLNFSQETARMCNMVSSLQKFTLINVY